MQEKKEVNNKRKTLFSSTSRLHEKLWWMHRNNRWENLLRLFFWTFLTFGRLMTCVILKIDNFSPKNDLIRPFSGDTVKICMSSWKIVSTFLFRPQSTNMKSKVPRVVCFVSNIHKYFIRQQKKGTKKWWGRVKGKISIKLRLLVVGNAINHAEGGRRNFHHFHFVKITCLTCVVKKLTICELWIW